MDRVAEHNGGKDRQRLQIQRACQFRGHNIDGVRVVAAAELAAPPGMSDAHAFHIAVVADQLNES